jgi:hypothetical protein
MAYLRRILVGAIGALTLAGAGAVGVGASDTLVAFDSMTGVALAGVNVVNDRGIAAGGAPWVVSSATGTVNHQGNVSVQVTGLIIPILSPPHNPIGAFSATVSCITPDGVRNVTIVVITRSPPFHVYNVLGSSNLADPPHPPASPATSPASGKVEHRAVFT